MSVAVRTPAMQLVERVRDVAFQEEVRLVLPPHITPQTWTRYLVTVLLEKPELAQVRNQPSLLTALIKGASYGIVPDGKKAALIVRKDKDHGDKVTFELMINGMVEYAAEFGWSVVMGVAYANDMFDYTDEPPAIWHTRTRPGKEPGERVAAYAIATHPYWGRRQQIMFPAQIAKRQAKAKTQEIWNEWPDEMWKKTVGRSLIDDLPKPERDRLERPAAPPPDVSHTMIYGPSKTPPPGLPAENAAPAHGDQSSGDAPEAAGEGPPSSSPSAAPEPFAETLDEIPWPGDEA